MARLYRTARGRLRHASTRCPKVLRKAVVESAFDGNALCQTCCATCVVCRVDPGVPMPCGDEAHALCDECMHQYLLHCASVAPEVAPTCPCGVGPALPLRELASSKAIDAWHDAVRNASISAAAPKPTSPPAFRLADEMCAFARERRCPWCDRLFADFDGCAALECHCKRWFCALCLHACDSSKHAHDHLRRDCPSNPTSSYYVAEEVYTRVWEEQARERMARSIQSLAQTEGIALTLIVATRIRRTEDGRRLLPLSSLMRLRPCSAVCYCIGFTAGLAGIRSLDLQKII